MLLRRLFLLLVVLLCFGVGCVANSDDNDMKFELGSEHGLTKDSTLSSDMLGRIQAGAEGGNRDNIYFLGLLKMYGVSLQKNERDAVVLLKKAARLGLPVAMTAVGYCAYMGIGMDKDDTVAVSWFRKGAAKQDVNAYWLLAKLLMEGSGVQTPSYAEAAVYFQMAAEKNIPQAEHHLAIMYEYGMGVDEDFLKAEEYYQRAAQQGFTEAMYHLGLMYAHGRPTINQDYKRAYPLFQAAAQNGHAPSTYTVGIFKTYGYGMEPNYQQAINWFERAALMGDDRVAELARSSATEIAAAVVEASEINEAIQDAYVAVNDEGAMDEEEDFDDDPGRRDWFEGEEEALRNTVKWSDVFSP